MQPKTSETRQALLVAAVVLAFVVVASAMVAFWPPAWPDEAAFTDAALNLVRHGRLGTPIYAAVVPGIGAHTYWQPPLYPLFLAPVVALFGPRLAAVRGASIALGVVALVLVYRLARRFAGPRAALCALALLAFEPMFVRAAAFARMELLAVTLTLAAVAAAVRALDDATRRTAWMGGSGAFAALAVLTHPLGLLAHALVLALVVTDGRRVGARAWLAFALPLAVALGAWGIYVAADPAAFAAQWAGQLRRKASLGLVDRARQWLGQYGIGAEFSAYVAHAHARRERWAAVLALEVAVVLVAGVRALVDRAAPARFVGVAALGAAVAAWLGGESWYPPYALPWMALAAAVLAARWRRSLVLAVALVVCIDLVTFASIVRERRTLGAQADVDVFSAELFRDIPDGATVFVASLPDPYFWARSHRRVTLLELPPPHFDDGSAATKAALARADWLIVSWQPFTRVPYAADDPAVAAAIRRARDARSVGTPGGAGYAARVYRLR